MNVTDTDPDKKKLIAKGFVSLNVAKGTVSSVVYYRFSSCTGISFLSAPEVF
jgi:hypothetical protein